MHGLSHRRRDGPIEAAHNASRERLGQAKSVPYRKDGLSNLTSSNRRWELGDKGGGNRGIEIAGSVGTRSFRTEEILCNSEELQLQGCGLALFILVRHLEF